MNEEMTKEDIIKAKMFTDIACAVISRSTITWLPNEVANYASDVVRLYFDKEKEGGER